MRRQLGKLHSSHPQRISTMLREVTSRSAGV
jgi:hypothetical protein